MAETTSPHPHRDLLVAFGMGRLEPDDATSIETHLEKCPKCCETLLDLKDDTFVGLIRGSHARAVPAAQQSRTEALQPAGARTEGPLVEEESFDETIVSLSGTTPGSGELPSELKEHPRYRIVERIGRGGMGDVYKAEHRLMNRAVAIKVINQDLVCNAQAVERFRREVQAAARLAHPNIVTAHDAEQAGDVHYLVMEFVDGTDLADIVKQQGPLDVWQACRFIRQAAAGLQHAHEQGMVHRDIKPHNLMVTAEGQVKILDFGLATLAALADPASRRLPQSGRQGQQPGDGPAPDEPDLPDGRTGSPILTPADGRHELTSAGTMMGTPDFISPEQAGDARSVDIRSDIYSLGCTLYYLLTGRPPFDEGTVMDRVKAHADCVAEPIESVRVDVPAELAEVIRRMMAKNPAERFQSPAAVADALAPFVDANRSSASDQIDTPRQGWSGWDRFLLATAVLTAVCLLLSTQGLSLLQLGILWIVGVCIGWGVTSLSGSGRLGRPTLKGWLTLGASIGLAGVIYVATDRGTLVIESEDENVEVTIGHPTSDTHEGFQVKVVDRVTGSEVVRLPSGHYRLLMGWGPGTNENVDVQSLQLSREQFVLKRGDKVIVRITRKSPTELNLPTTADTASRQPVARAKTREKLKEFISAARLATTQDDWKTVVAAYAPELFDLPLDSSRDLIDLLADLPDPMHETLLEEGYLRWKATSLDKERQAAVRNVVSALLSRAPNVKEPPGDDQIPARLEQSDVGFVVLTLPDTDDQTIAWYLLDRQRSVPIILQLSGSTVAAVRALVKPEVREQVTLLQGKTYSDIPPGPAAQPETVTALKNLVAAAPDAITDDQWKAFLEEHARALSEFPTDISRPLIGLMTGLPVDARDTLLREGYLKWRFQELDAARQESMRKMYHKILSMGFQRGVDDATVDRMTRALESVDVGFAVVNLPDKAAQSVVWYILMPSAPIPIMMPISTTTPKESKPGELSKQVYEQLSELEGKPYSELPFVPVAGAQMRQLLNDLVEAARQATTDDDWDRVLREHAPMLALRDVGGGSEQFGAAEMALMRKAGLTLVELLAGFPDEVQDELRNAGYLKWRFTELDEPRQSAMRDALTSVLGASSKMGFPANLQQQVPAMLASGDVGFAVIDMPEGQGVVWYLNMPNSPLPMMLPIFGAKSGGDQSIFSKSAFKQLGELEDKPYSNLMPLLKPADMQRLQGVWNFIRGEANGRPATPRTLEIAANVWLMKDPQSGRTLERMTFDIDPTQDPKQITLSMAKLPQPMEAIYRIVDDELHVTAASAPGGERPTRFDEGGEGRFFVIMRREPPPDVTRMNMEAALKQSQERHDASQQIPYALWESDGKAVMRFANWLLIFEGIDAAPGIRGLGAFRVPDESYDDSKRSGGGATFGTSGSPLKLTVDDRIIDGVSTVSVNDVEFKMQGRAETLTFGDVSYTDDDTVQSIVIRADGTTTLQPQAPK